MTTDTENVVSHEYRNKHGNDRVTDKLHSGKQVPFFTQIQLSDRFNQHQHYRQQNRKQRCPQ